MGFHEYRNIWTPHKNEVLLTRMKPTNKKDRFAVVVINDKDLIIGHLMKGKDGRFKKAIFYFLRASEYYCCSVCVTGKGDNKGMKVPCTSLFKGQSEFVDVLYQELKKHV